MGYIRSNYIHIDSYRHVTHAYIYIYIIHLYVYAHNISYICNNMYAQYPWERCEPWLNKLKDPDDENMAHCASLLSCLGGEGFRMGAP